MLTVTPRVAPLNEYNPLLCLGLNNCEKVFDTVGYITSFEALRKTNINETHARILQYLYSQATARIHSANLVSDEIVINRGVRQGDLLSPTLFNAVMEEILRRQIYLKESE